MQFRFHVGLAIRACGSVWGVWEHAYRRTGLASERLGLCPSSLPALAHFLISSLRILKNVLCTIPVPEKEYRQTGLSVLLCRCALIPARPPPPEPCRPALLMLLDATVSLTLDSTEHILHIFKLAIILFGPHLQTGCC